MKFKTYTLKTRMTEEDRELEAFYQKQARIKKHKATRQARRATPQGGGNWIGFTSKEG